MGSEKGRRSGYDHTPAFLLLGGPSGDVVPPSPPACLGPSLFICGLMTDILSIFMGIIWCRLYVSLYSVCKYRELR